MKNSAILASKYEHLFIDKNGKRVDLKGKTTSFDYYESLLSPNATAIMTIVDTGSTTFSDSKYDRQNRIGTLYNSLPLNAKDEKIEFVISSKLGRLNFEKYPFYVNAISNPSQTSTREAILLSLVSKPSIDSLQNPLFNKYNGRISDSVRRILSEDLKIPINKLFIENTENSYSFLGRGKSPFENILDLCPKSISIKGDPGFFFYETQDGFNFRSIDSLISQKPKKIYRRTDVLREGISNDQNDTKILSVTVNKNQDLIAAVKSGVYVSRNVFFDVRNLSLSEDIVKLNDIGIKNSLGKDPDIPSDLTNYARTHYKILDVGTLDSNLYGDVNNSPRIYQARSTIRYNILFSQVISLLVPCNPNLRAGDVITCNFEVITQGEKVIDVNDPTQSGNYLILHLCHHFDPKRSYTSLTLVRDTYGINTNKK